MVNIFGYNRKTKEEDDKILAAVKRHHDFIAEQGYFVVMTSLIGSQNYDLDYEESDIDTFSFIFPSLEQLARADQPEAGTFVVEDGHCNYKDIRCALNLLKSTSPNSVEYFVSKYKIYNPKFEILLKEYLEDNDKMWHMVHCNYEHMLNGIAGMSRQLTTRNMPAGYRFSHALRLISMHHHFINSHNASAVLDMKMDGTRDLALDAKRDKTTLHIDEYNSKCEEISEFLDTLKNKFVLTEEYQKIQIRGNALIDELQKRLTKQYLMEIK